MELSEVINKRKSVRGYREEQITDDELEAILAVANNAPNAGPFQVTVIQNRKLLKDINDTAKGIMLASEGFMKERASLPGYEPLYGAPTLLVLSAPEGPFTQTNVACSATTMILKATDLEIGTCYAVSPILALSQEKFKNKLELPEGFEPVATVLIGYENGEAFPTSKEMIDNINRIL